MKIAALFILFVLQSMALASEGVKLDDCKNDLCNKASLQRGAGIYANYCAGCHELQYVRFSDLAKNLFVDDKGVVLEKLVNDNLNQAGQKPGDAYRTAMPKKDAQVWFGVAPPDLSLVIRSRGKNWVYSYLRGFYTDPKRPWGVNNVVFPDVAMPHILLPLQGTQVPVYKTVKVKDDQGNVMDKQIVASLKLEQPGKLTPAQYDKAMTDLVNFLEYVSEPHKMERERLGVWVVLFLIVFTFFAYLLKREYWKDVH